MIPVAGPEMKNLRSGDDPQTRSPVRDDSSGFLFIGGHRQSASLSYCKSHSLAVVEIVSVLYVQLLLNLALTITIPKDAAAEEFIQQYMFWLFRGIQ